jgi:hypothetical protein
LCEEFGFSEIAAKLSEFRPSIDFKEAEDSDPCGRIAVLEEKVNQHSHVIAIFAEQSLSTDFERLVGENSSLRLSEEVSVLKTQITQKLNDPVWRKLSTDFIEFRKEFLTQKAQIAAMSLTVTPSLTTLPQSITFTPS